MGACATKPKADATDAPAPLPEKDEVVKNELSVASPVVQTKELDVDAADNSRSLSNLLQEVISLLVECKNQINILFISYPKRLLLNFDINNFSLGRCKILVLTRLFLKVFVQL